MTEWIDGQDATLDYDAIGEKINAIYKQGKKEHRYNDETGFAESIGTNQPKISAAMHGKLKLTVEQYCALAIQSGTSLDDLLCLPGSSSNRLSPRDICSMLSDIYESEYKFEISGNPESGMILVFPDVTSEQQLPQHAGASYRNVERSAINNFLANIRNIAECRTRESAFDDNMYNTLMDSFLKEVPDRTESAERQIEWNKANDPQWEEHLEFIEGSKAAQKKDHAAEHSEE